MAEEFNYPIEPSWAIEQIKNYSIKFVNIINFLSLKGFLILWVQKETAFSKGELKMKNPDTKQSINLTFVYKSGITHYALANNTHFTDAELLN